MKHLHAYSENLCRLSIRKHSLAFTQFDWPDTLPENVWWQSPDLLTIAYTDYGKDLTEQQLMQLAKWECINSFSLNFTGELELIQQVSKILNHIASEAREYLFHLINEENQHMWYFQKFCEAYAGKVYGNKNFQIETHTLTPAQDHFLVFARILIFEEIGHYYNIQNTKDDRLHPFIRQINDAHFKDESRHIAYGRQMLEYLAPAALAEAGSATLLGQALDNAININIGALYNARAYRDAGISQGMQLRNALLNHPERIAFHHSRLIKNVKSLLKRLNIPITCHPQNN